MGKYIIKRLLLIIPTLLGVLFIVFAIMNLTPGIPADRFWECRRSRRRWMR